jgi:hypothetical protein
VSIPGIYVWKIEGRVDGWEEGKGEGCIIIYVSQKLDTLIIIGDWLYDEAHHFDGRTNISIRSEMI